MKVTEPCPICTDIYPCDCQKAVLSFFNLLEAVHKRVLSEKPASAPQPKVVSAGIDKLNAYFLTSVSKADLIDRAKSNGYTTNVVFLKDRKPYLAIAQEERCVHLRVGMDQSQIVGLVSNPNRFKSWQHYTWFLKTILEPEILDSTKVSRLDLNLDLETSFQDLMQMIDIRNKRSALSFNDESGKRTGCIIGKGSEKVAIYDKALKENSDTPRSRIEVRLAGSKLPGKSIWGVPETICNQPHFENLIGVSVAYLEDQRTDHLQRKLQQFKFMFEHDGFYLAKKHFNMSRNFERDFSKLIKVTSWPIQPEKLFRSTILQFMQKEGGNQWTQQTRERTLVH